MHKSLLSLSALLFLLTACHKKTFEEQIMDDVQHFNEKEAPKRQDPFSVFDSMNYDVDTRTVGYYYTVEGASEELFPANEMRDNVLKNLRASIQLKPHKEHKINFRYKYYGKASGKVLLDALYTPEDYN